MEFNRPQTPASAERRSIRSARTTSLNDRLNTDYIDLGATDESSFCGQVTKTITGCVGEFVTPRQLLIVLRILKAVTFSFLVLTLAANTMYIIFLEVLATREVRDIVGGRRDMIIRVYGLFLVGVALAVEVDVAWVVKSFYGFKGFIPRAFLLFFISACTGAHPLHEDQLQNGKTVDQYKYYNNYAADDAAAGYDDAVVNDDFFTYAFVSPTLPQIPDSVIVFQMVTSFVLGVCAIAYFVFGLLCLDRFTSKAYLSSNDPLVTTAIPQPMSTMQQQKNNIVEVPEMQGQSSTAFQPIIVEETVQPPALYEAP